MLHQTRGIVFKSIKYGETSLISKIYTEHYGLQSYIVKGIRTARSKMKAGLLQPLTLLDMQVYRRENKNLQYLKELSPAVLFTDIPFDVAKSSVGIFMIEILLQSIKEEETNSVLFNYLFETISKLDKTKKPTKDFHLHFLIHLSKLLGFFPSGNFSEKNSYFDLQEGTFTASVPPHPLFLADDSAKSFSLLIQAATQKLAAFDFNNLERKELLQNLLTYYSLHVSNFKTIRSVKVLEEVMRG